MAGAAAVFPENLAAGLALAHQALLLTGFTQDDAAGVITKVRAELNPELLGRVGVTKSRCSCPQSRSFASRAWRLRILTRCTPTNV
jgi:hypothetical protein